MSAKGYGITINKGKLKKKYDAYSGKPTFPHRKLVVGMRRTGAQFGYVGDMDKLGIFRERLSQPEIAPLMKKELK